MAKTGFDNEKYIKMQSENIKKRISQFGGKLYLEFGGKLFDDTHASRVLPGFKPDSKLQMLLELKDQAEIVIAVSAEALESSKRRGDSGITYDQEVLRLIDKFRSVGLFVGSVVITRNNGQAAALNLQRELEEHDIPVFKHYYINGYPSNVPLIVSDDGFGKNDYIETSRSLIVITAPGPGSGKLATCLSQLYHETKRGIQAGYAKFETFPIWNIPLKHPVNLAYEAATADLSDVNMIDYLHLEAYNKVTVNYNRDLEAFPIVAAIFKKIYGSCPYQSPTDMGVNMAGYCISDDMVCQDASRYEIIRRYYNTMLQDVNDKNSSHENEIQRIENIMDQLGITPKYRKVVQPAIDAEKESGVPCMSIELPDGTIVTGKRKAMMHECAAAVINALKVMAGIPDEIDLVPKNLLDPVQDMKRNFQDTHSARLHTDEALIAIAVNAATDENAAKAIACLPELRGCDAHTTIIPSNLEVAMMRRLSINLTCEPKYEGTKLFRL